MFKVIALFAVLLFSAYIKSAEYPPHVGNSPFSFDKIKIPSNTFVVSDKDQDNDVYLLRKDAKTFDLQFSLKIDRYVGDVTKLKENKLISDKFKISLPVFDVDGYPILEDCDGDGEPDLLAQEIDEVYFNGEKIGVLSGSHELWAENTFELDISKLNLPTSPGEVSDNLVPIRIDAGNQFVKLSSGAIGCQKWAVEVDYVTLEYEVADPLLFLPGMGGSASAFNNSGYIQVVEDLGLPYLIIEHDHYPEEDACLNNDGSSIKEFGRGVLKAAKEFSAKYKSNNFNVIAHSKGGLDARYFTYLTMNEKSNSKTLVENGLMDDSVILNDMNVNSIVSHSSPFNGTIVADAIKFDNFEYSTSARILFADICDMTIDVATEFSKTYLFPPKVKVLSISGNIDADNDGFLSTDELDGNQVGGYFSIKMFDLIKGVSHYEVQYKKSYLQTFEYDEKVYIPIANSSPKLNDSMVSVDSASPVDADVNVSIFSNHGTVIKDKAQKVFLEEVLNGELGWIVLK